jgi:transcriptional regulator with XRE-family HTH domain
VGTRERAIDRATRRARAIQSSLGLEIRAARLAAGLSQREVGRAASMDHALVGRVERGQHPNVPLAQLHRLAAAVGLDLGVRTFPHGDALRDAAHTRLLERLRAHLGPGLRWRMEVALPGPGDLRAWDATISNADRTIGIEAETVLQDGQAQIRRVMLKARDGCFDQVVLLVAGTKRNRAALATIREALSGDFPLDSAAVLRELRAGRLPD